MRVLAVVPARCGSKRVPHKNIEFVGGEMLVARARRAAINAGLGDYVISTDCVTVAKTFTMDSRERQCGGDGPMADVLLEALGWFTVEGVNLWDAVCCVQPSSPFRTTEHVKSVVAMLEQNPQAKSAVSVNADTGERNGAVYVTRVEMLRDGLVFDEHSLKYPMPAERSLDINTPADLELARAIAKEKGW